MGRDEQEHSLRPLHPAPIEFSQNTESCTIGSMYVNSESAGVDRNITEVSQNPTTQ